MRVVSIALIIPIAVLVYIVSLLCISEIKNNSINKIENTIVLLGTSLVFILADILLFRIIKVIPTPLEIITSLLVSILILWLIIRILIK